MFVIVSGSSGVGKNTVLNNIFEKDKSMKNLVSYTTRAMRNGEYDGLYYHYVTKDEFLKLYDANEFAEMEEIHGNYYGTKFSDIENAVQSSDIYVKDLGVEGAKNMQAIVGKENVLCVFIDAPKEVLRERLIGRGEKEIDLRLSRYDYEHQYLDIYDYVVQNIDLETCVNEVYSLIKNYKKKEITVKESEKCQKN